MDGEEVYRRQQEARAFVQSDPHFVVSSTHRNWLGKIKCAYCNKTGWTPDPTGADLKWWVRKHGSKCKRKTYWHISQPMNTIGNMTWSNTSATYTITVTSGSGWIRI